MMRKALLALKINLLYSRETKKHPQILSKKKSHRKSVYSLTNPKSITLWFMLFLVKYSLIIVIRWKSGNDLIIFGYRPNKKSKLKSCYSSIELIDAKMNSSKALENKIDNLYHNSIEISNMKWNGLFDNESTMK